MLTPIATRAVPPVAHRRGLQTETRRIVLLGRDAARSNGVAVPSLPKGFQLENLYFLRARRHGFHVEVPVSFEAGLAIRAENDSVGIPIRHPTQLHLDMEIEGNGKKHGYNQPFGIMIMGYEHNGTPVTLHYWFHDQPKGAFGVTVRPNKSGLFSITLPPELARITRLEFVGEAVYLRAFIREMQLVFGRQPNPS